MTRQAKHIAGVVNGRERRASQFAEERHLRFDADLACQVRNINRRASVVPTDNPHFDVVVTELLDAP